MNTAQQQRFINLRLQGKPHQPLMLISVPFAVLLSISTAYPIH
ncbi:hypothetical protein [Psychrobium sp. 1_MG-2023]|nr:hypothetical protein [Psychrobium sp. 1_MG-2023]MDP2561793.1 hypothetical protein [Psychrobium sp. 1_MG-2023]